MTHPKMKPQSATPVDSSWLLLIGVIGLGFILIGIFAAANDDDRPLFSAPTLDGKTITLDMPLFVKEEIYLSTLAGVAPAENAALQLVACQAVKTLPTLEDEFFHVNAETGSYWLHITATEQIGQTGWLPLEALTSEACN